MSYSGNSTANHAPLGIQAVAASLFSEAMASCIRRSQAHQLPTQPTRSCLSVGLDAAMHYDPIDREAWPGVAWPDWACVEGATTPSNKELKLTKPGKLRSFAA